MIFRVSLVPFICLILDSQQIVGGCKPPSVAKLCIHCANFVLGSALSEAWNLIIVPFICLVNSWIKGDEAEHEWHIDCKPQLGDGVGRG